MTPKERSTVQRIRARQQTLAERVLARLYDAGDHRAYRAKAVDAAGESETGPGPAAQLGNIWVESAAEQGTTSYALLPILQESPDG
jgi:hypothetical protein